MRIWMFLCNLHFPDFWFVILLIVSCDFLTNQSVNAIVFGSTLKSGHRIGIYILYFHGYMATANCLHKMAASFGAITPLGSYRVQKRNDASSTQSVTTGTLMDPLARMKIMHSHSTFFVVS